MKTLACLCNSHYNQNRFLKDDPEATAEPLRKKWVTWKKPCSDLQIGVLQLMPSNQSSQITAHTIWFVSPFTILSSFEKRAKKRERGNKSHKERFYMLECSWKKLDELFPCWKRSICFPTANIYFPNSFVAMLGGWVSTCIRTKKIGFSFLLATQADRKKK